MQIMNYDSGMGSEENWIIKETFFDERYPGKCEAVFSQGNGYLGLRHALEEQYIGETRDMFVAGSFNKASAKEVTELPNVPDITNMELEICGERFGLNRGIVKSYSRTLNLRTGEVIRHVDWISPSGHNVGLCFHRFVSMDNVHIIGSYVEIFAPDEDLEVVLSSGINARVSNEGAQHFVEGSKLIHEGRFLEYPVTTTESGVLIIVQTVHRFSQTDVSGISSRIINNRRKLTCRYEFTVKKNTMFRAEKLSCVHSGRDVEYVSADEKEIPDRLFGSSRKLIREEESQGYDELFLRSKTVWETFWQNQDIVIESENKTDQLSIRFALYHIQIMTRKDDARIGIGAKGLSGEGYKGHSFWDTETFIFPYFQFTDQKTAKTLLGYRYLGLYGARKKAAENGYDGAMYPWESAWINDGEVTPDTVDIDPHTGKTKYCLTGKIELHITCDITYALWQYYIATGDEDFMRRYGYEMLIETSRFWCSRLEWIKESGRYEIRDVIGPDEYKEHVNNNAYTNYMVKYSLDITEKIIGEISKNDPDTYNRLSKLADLKALRDEIRKKSPLIYLPAPDGKTGIIPQFDGYFDLRKIELSKYKNANVVGTLFHDYTHEEINRCQAGKQADVIELLYQLDDLVSPEIKKKNYIYYEARTLHDSSLSKAIHSIAACDMGLEDEALDMFRKAADTDMGPVMTTSDKGIHSANMGGIWQDVVMGFGGVRITGSDLRISPHLPSEWERLEYNIFWKGSRLKVKVTGKELSVENEGKPVEVILKDKKTVLAAGKNTVVL